LRNAGIGLLAMLSLLAIGLWWLSSDSGQRWVVGQATDFKSKSGFHMSIGSFSGSLYSHARIREVRLGDTRGTFLTIHDVTIDWSPTKLWRKRVVIQSADVRSATWHYMPKFTATGGPLLPDWDIDIGNFSIRKLAIEPAVAGKTYRLMATGKANIQAGRAQVTLDAASSDTQDKIHVVLDSVPDSNRFDTDIRVAAPANGLIATLAKWQPGMTLDVTGKGSFARWRGTLLARTENVDALDARLALDNGQLLVTGNLHAPASLDERMTRAIAALPMLSATATYKNTVLDTRGSLSGPSAKLVWTGNADLERNFVSAAKVSVADPDGVLIGIADPALVGRNARFEIKATGDLKAPELALNFTADQLAWQKYGLAKLIATASTEKYSPRTPWQFKISAKEGKTGLSWLDPKLSVLSGSGQFLATAAGLSVSSLQLKGNDLIANASVSTVFKSGAWQAEIANLSTRIDAGANGMVPVTLKGKAVAASAQAPAIISATGNASLAGWRGPQEVARLLGKAPAFSAMLSVMPNGVTRASALSVEGNGSRFVGQLSLGGGVVDAELKGTIKSLATVAPDLPVKVQPNMPVVLTVRGPIGSPQIAAELQTPLLQIAGAELRRVMLRLQPDGQSQWLTSLKGEAGFGAVDFAARLETGNGKIMLRDLRGSAGPAKITGAMSINQSGIATGTLQASMDEQGQQLQLKAELTNENAVQKISATLAGRKLSQKWNGKPVSVENVAGEFAVLLGRAPAVRARISVKDAIWADWQISTLSLDGSGPLTDYNATYSVAGTRGSAFKLDGSLTARGKSNMPDRIEATASGTVANRSFKLTTPARVVRLPDGWQLERTELNYAGGKAAISATDRGSLISADIDLSNTSLELLNLVQPSLNLTGTANGKTSLQVLNGKLARLNGTIALKRVRRAGLFQSSLPLDLTGTVTLNGQQLVSLVKVRANGRDAGNADIRVTRESTGAFATGGIAGTVNYDGPAEALWGLIGADANDVRGRLLIKSTLAGSVSDPVLRGNTSLRDGRYENIALGLIVNAVSVDGVFDGSKLSFENGQANFPAGGTITGKGSIDISTERGFPALISLSLNRAAVLKRDDLDIVATGTLAVTYGPKGGRVSGPLVINQARIRAGGATSQSVSEIEVREINKPLDLKNPAVVRRITKPFELDLDITAKEKIFVSGLGLNSEWRGAVHAGGTTTIPRLTGQMALIRGTYEFANRRFAVERGAITFQGTTPVNPVINIRASTRAGDRDIIIQVNGTAGQPDITFAASPSLPQDEVLSRLLFGSSIQELSPLEAVQLAAALNQLSSSRGGLNVLGSVKRVTGIDRLRVLPADRTKGSNTALSGGKYLTDRIYVEVATDGRGYTATTIEYDITRTLSVLSEIATLGGTNVGIKYSKDY
jgi:translocation and assembly module TamB